MLNLPPIEHEPRRGRKKSVIGQLAELATIEYSAMRKIVISGQRPGRKRVERIAQACGVSAQWVFYG